MNSIKWTQTYQFRPTIMISWKTSNCRTTWKMLRGSSVKAAATRLVQSIQTHAFRRSEMFTAEISASILRANTNLNESRIWLRNQSNQKLICKRSHPMLMIWISRRMTTQIKIRDCFLGQDRVKIRSKVETSQYNFSKSISSIARSRQKIAD